LSIPMSPFITRLSFSVSRLPFLSHSLFCYVTEKIILATKNLLFKARRGVAFRSTLKC
jgi:hypothetical protein